MARLFDTPRAQVTRLLALEQKRRAADRQVAAMTPAQADQLAAMNKWFPWMPAGVMYSLARAGQEAMGNPLIANVALQALIAKEKSAMGLGQKGDLVDEKEQARKDWVRSLEGGNPISKAVRKVGPALRDNPVTNEVLEPLARATITGENPLPRGLRAFSRMAGAVGDYPRQMAQGTYRSVSADIQDKGFAGFGRDFLRDTPGRLATGGFGPGATIDAGMQTELGQMALQTREMGRLDTGRGFFVGGRVKEAQHEAEQEFGTILYPDGSRHARSIGRDLAGLVSEPGSDAYTAISGGADFMVAMGADQATFGGALTQMRAARQLKAGGLGPRAAQAASEGRSMTVRENLIDAMGGIAAPGKRLTVSPEGVRNFLASGNGERFVDRLVNTTSIRTLDRLTGGNWDPASLLAIADETDPDVMRATAEQLLTTGRVKGMPTTKLSDYGFRLREAAPEHVRALNARMPKTGGQARHLRNPRESMTQFEREMDYLDINEETQDKFLRKFADAPELGIVDPELANVASATHRRAVFEEFEDHMKGELSRSVGMDDKGVAKTRKLLQRENERWKGETNYFVNQGVPESFFGLIARRTKRNVGRRESDQYFDDIVDAEVVDQAAIGKGLVPTSGPDWRTQANAYDDEIRRTIANRTFLEEDIQLVPKHMLDEVYGGEGWTPAEMLQIHRDEIRDALDRGNQVPYFVMKDYPDLIEEYGVTFPKMGATEARAALPERAGLSPVVDDTVDAELLDEFENWEETTEFLQPNVPTPWDLNELQSHYMPSPDWRKVKHQMGVIGKMHANGIEVPLTAMRGVQTAWKGLVIARPALLLRVMGEIQFAMTLRGASTWINHPLDMIAYVMGDSKAPKMLERFKGRGASDIRGERWAGHEDDAGDWVDGQVRWQTMENTSTFYRKQSDKALGNEYIIANKHQNPEGYYAGMADELHTISKSTFMFQRASDMLQGKSVDESIGWAWNNMPDERRVLANAFEDGDKILTIDGLDAYMRGVDERILQATGNGNPELLQSLVSRKLRGETYDIKGVRNDRLNDVLRGFADNLPDDMRAPKTSNRGALTTMRDALKSVHGTALDIMFSNRERTLNRSPEFRQFYFKHAIENSRIVDPAEADAFVANLEKAGMKRNDIRTAKHYAQQPVDTPMTLREVDDLSFAQAQDDMQFFLEDLVDKKRWVEALSIVSPFAHVISESMTRWGKILSNPSAVAKVQRPFKAARDPELGDIANLNEDETDPERRGLLYKDAQGNERMAFPLSAKMTGILGDPIPLHGRTQGLNMIGDFSPGVGPFASVPLAATFERFDNPRYDKIRDWVFPYGTPQGGVIERNVKAFAPTWLRKAVTEETPQQIIDAMYYKSSTGEYNVQGEGATVEEINRLVNDSKQLAFVTKISNAAATFFAPTAPSPEWFIETESGQRLPMLTVIKDLQALRDADPRNATLNMLEKYGDNVFLMLVGKSIAVSPGVLPATDEAEKWVRSQGKDLRGSYKNTYGFFAPQEGDFSFDAYRRLLDNGDRRLNKPEDVPFIANDMVAKARYYALRAKLDNPSGAASAKLLRDFRTQLEKEYPGYVPGGQPGGTVNRAEPSELIEELKASTTDKKLENHEAMPALKQYLDFREQVNALAPKGRGANWWHTAKDGRKARAMAAKFGDELAQENKAFAGMWEGALRREFESALANDDTENAGGG